MRLQVTTTPIRLSVSQDGPSAPVRDRQGAGIRDRAGNLIEPRARFDPLRAFMIYGDSTARGDGASVQWFTTLVGGYDPDRIYLNFGVSGQGINTMSDAMVAATGRRDWTTIIYDRRNGGETAASWLSYVTTAVATLTGRFLIMPQVAMTSGETAQTVLDDINTGIRAAWPNNTFNLATETAFLTALSDPATRDDGLHRNNAGQAIEAAYIRAWLDAKNW